MSDRKPTADEVRAAWDANAAFWDERMEAGETWQRNLIAPVVERLLDLRPGESVLEIACGNGEFARRMATLGARVLATDFSGTMVERARARSGDVEYRIADAGDEAQLTSLGEPGSFDAVVCNMALMDMAEIDPLASAAVQLLVPGGRLVFSTAHPAFNGLGVTRIVEQFDDEHGVQRLHWLKLSEYAHLRVGRGVAIEGQPSTHWYFDRSIQELFGAFFNRGFVLDALEEPVMRPEDVTPESSSAVFARIPPVLVARMRPAPPP
jgi:SAM-dependent methyltransferase